VTPYRDRKIKGVGKRNYEGRENGILFPAR